MTKLSLSFLFTLLLSSVFAVSLTAERFDFFYLVQQWPGSLCDTREGCCFPDTVKPAADFGIHGLWPNYADCRGVGGGSQLARAVLRIDAAADAVLSRIGLRGRCYPENCNDGNRLRPWEIRDLLKSLDQNWGTLSCKNKGGGSFGFWSHEWRKHGTCSNMDQHCYFASALAIKARHNLTSILAKAGIVPSDTQTYGLASVRDAIKAGTGHAANIECNRNARGEAQLFQVYQCVDPTGKKLIDCPTNMPGRWCDRLKLPVF